MRTPQRKACRNCESLSGRFAAAEVFEAWQPGFLEQEAMRKPSDRKTAAWHLAQRRMSSAATRHSMPRLEISYSLTPPMQQFQKPNSLTHRSSYSQESIVDLLVIDFSAARCDCPGIWTSLRSQARLGQLIVVAFAVPWSTLRGL